MNKPLPPAEFDENPEWTDEMVARAKPASEVVGPEAAAALTRKRGAAIEKSKFVARDWHSVRRGASLKPR